MPDLRRGCEVAVEELEQAIALYRQIARVQPVFRLRLGTALVNTAGIVLALGDSARAEAMIGEAVAVLREDPVQPYALAQAESALASVLAVTGQTDRAAAASASAVATWRAAAAVDPDHQVPLARELTRGGALAMNRDDGPAALCASAEAVGLLSGLPTAPADLEEALWTYVNVRGTVAVTRADLADAATALLALLEMTGDGPRAVAHAAMFLAALADQDVGLDPGPVAELRSRVNAHSEVADGPQIV